MKNGFRETTTSFPMSLNPKCTSRSVISTSAYISWKKNIQHFNLMSPLHIRFLFFSARRKRRKYLLLKLKQIPTYCFSSKLWNSLTFPFIYRDKKVFPNFSCRFLNPNIFLNLKNNCSNLLDLKNLQELVKKAFCNEKLFWPFTVST